MAKVWRRVGGLMVLVMPARAAYWRRLWNTVMRGKAAAPPLADKHEILLARLGRDGGAVDKPQLQLFGGAGRHGHKPFLAPLAHNPQEAFFEKQIGHFQVAQLAYAQSAAVKHLNHGAVALTERLRKVDGGNYGVHLFEGKYLG